MAASIGGENGEMGFQIAPMVDVVFVLLLFFMASAGSQIVEKELTINLPSGKGTSYDLSLIIEISRDGRVVMNNEALGAPGDRNLSQLKERIKGVIEYGSEVPVIIRPNSDARQERIVEVLNACSYAGVRKLTFM